jgi:cobalt/nickel transport system permease protein
MDHSVRIFEFPWEFLAVPVGALVLLWALFFGLRKRRSQSVVSGAPTEEKDWSIPAIDSQAGIDSPFHRWDPRIKLVCLLFFVFCAASLTRLSTACLGVLAAAASVLAARIPLERPLRRLAAMTPFLGMLLIVMPFTVFVHNGDTVVLFGGLTFFPFNLRGFLLALLICLKASAVALMVEPLLGTSPFPVTIQALARLKVPSTVCQMLLLAHRYIFVFQDETDRMKTGMGARGFRGRTDVETLRATGNFLGMLLVRSFERTQRVYEAMLARGYDHTLPVTARFEARGSDWAKGVFWVILGLAMMAADRLWK